MFRVDLFRLSTMKKGPVITTSLDFGNEGLRLVGRWSIVDFGKEGFRLVGRWSVNMSVAVDSRDRRGERAS